MEVTIVVVSYYLIQPSKYQDCSFKLYLFRPDCYIPCQHDRYITPRPYECHEVMSNRIDYDGKARKIQKCYRGWKMLKNIKECTEEYRRIVSDCRKFEEEKNDLHRYITSRTKLISWSKSF